MADEHNLASYGTKAVLVVHGGAGAISRERLSAHPERQCLAKLEEALRAGFSVIRSGGTSLDGVIAAVKILEDVSVFNAGRGSCLTRKGTIEMDAAVMEGTRLFAGAVAGVTCVKNPVTAARAVLDYCPHHVLLVGPGADAFARKIAPMAGLKIVDQAYFRTRRAERHLERFLEAEKAAKKKGKRVSGLTTGSSQEDFEELSAEEFGEDLPGEQSNGEKPLEKPVEEQLVVPPPALPSPVPLAPRENVDFPKVSRGRRTAGAEANLVSGSSERHRTPRAGADLVGGGSERHRTGADLVSESSTRAGDPGDLDLADLIDPLGKKYGTVGAVAVDRFGCVAAATSTGGLVGKDPGRVGDSPIIGAGTYADNETCALSATGTGEHFIRNVIGHEVSALIRYKGLSLRAAAEHAMFVNLARTMGDGGLITINRAGEYAMVYNTLGMYRGVVFEDGRVVTSIFA